MPISQQQREIRIADVERLDDAGGIRRDAQIGAEAVDPVGDEAGGQEAAEVAGPARDQHAWRSGENVISGVHGRLVRGQALNHHGVAVIRRTHAATPVGTRRPHHVESASPDTRCQTPQNAVISIIDPAAGKKVTRMMSPSAEL